METRSDAIRHLAKVMAVMRPEWDTGGIQKILEADSRPLPELIAVGIAVATDKTARTPGVIRSKELPVRGIDPHDPRPPMPPDVRAVLAAVKQPDDVAHRGAALARSEMANAKADDW